MAGGWQNLKKLKKEISDDDVEVGTGKRCQSENAGDSGSNVGKAIVINSVTSEEDQVVKKQLQSFIDTLTEINAEMEFTDVILKCGNRTFKAHKLILCANSPYFRTMFHSGLSEVETGIVNLKGIDPEAFEIVRKFMYFGSFPPVRDTNKLKSLLAAAHLLLMTNLYEYCCDEYMEKLDHNTFVDIWNTAEQYENVQMLYSIPNELAKIFCNIKNSREFLSLSVFQLRKLVTAFGNSRYSSDEILGSILYWIKHDQKNRSQHMLQLLMLVDLNHLSTNFLSTVLKNEDVVMKCPGIASLLLNIAAARLPGLSTPLEADQTKFVVLTGVYPFSFDYCNIKKKTWSKYPVISPYSVYSHIYGMPQSNVPRSAITAVCMKNWLYCLLGSTSRPHTHTEIIKCHLQQIRGPPHYEFKWQSCCHLLEHRKSTVLAALADEIYIVGGIDINGKKLRSVERYSTVYNRCYQVSPMINPHYTQGVVASGSFLYVVEVENSKNYH